MAKTFEMKHDVIVETNHLGKECKTLSKLVRVTSRRYEVVGDPRHAAIIIKELGIEKCMGSQLLELMHRSRRTIRS